MDLYIHHHSHQKTVSLSQNALANTEIYIVPVVLPSNMSYMWNPMCFGIWLLWLSKIHLRNTHMLFCETVVCFIVFMRNILLYLPWFNSYQLMKSWVISCFGWLSQIVGNHQKLGERHGRDSLTESPQKDSTLPSPSFQTCSL